MATVSPITINSSSPRSLRIPTITPPSLHRPSNKPVSSSPQLPSPSTFVRPRVPVLKSGSRAQNAPEGVNIGFASAASLWKDKRFEAEQHDDEKIESRSRRPVGDVVSRATEKTRLEGTGKLKKPKRTGRTPELSDGRLRTPLLNDFEYCGSPLAKRSHIDTLAQPNVYDVVAEPIFNGVVTTRSPSLSLTKFAFDDIAKQSEPTTAVGVPKRVKKVRKTAAKIVEGDGVKIAKKPRKKKAKSESIILNSDDPEPGDAVLAFPLHDDEGARRDVQSRVKSKKSKQRATNLCEGEKENVVPVGLSPSPTNSPEISQPTGGAIARSRETPDQSIYFAKPDATVERAADSTLTTTPVRSVRPPEQQPVESHTLLDAPSVGMAPRRRLDWTPAKDTTVVDMHHSRPQTANSEVSIASHDPRIQLTEILNNFAYAAAPPESAMVSERTPTGEAATKRRRIELSEPVTAHVTTVKVLAKDSVKKAKSVKKPKKKPHTVTAQATSAYLPQTEIETEQATVSAFFSPPKENVTTAGEAPTDNLCEAQQTAAKPKKPRKPRAKSVTTTGGEANASDKPKKKRSKKSKATDADDNKETLRLYSPSQATAQMKRQDFLFGTSSQLAPAESPEFIRQMQIAMQESEKMQTRTSLALAKPYNVLWDLSARDSEGGLLQKEDLDELVSTVDAEVIRSGKACPANGVFPASQDPHTRTAARETTVDLPAPTNVLQQSHENPPVAIESMELPVDVPLGNLFSVLHQKRPEEDVDDWIILKSDDSNLTEQGTQVAAPMPSPSKESNLSPQIFRPALKTLDSNASIDLHKFSGVAVSPGQLRMFSSRSQDQDKPAKRPRGRPRKDARVVAGSLTSPTKIIRSKEFPVAASSPPRRTAKKNRVVASQPEPQAGWLDVDDISDCDAPNTPSPPRWRASSTPSALRTLQLSPFNSQNVEESEPAMLKGKAIKSDGPQWPSMKAALFPRITSTVKSAPRSNDPSNLSWWQKILMYDPLVVEDLTAWLDDQGLRVETRKLKATKGKKRKADVEKDEQEDYEMCLEPLQPWMVQKWCEAKSICCYVKDGSWRAKRGA